MSFSTTRNLTTRNLDSSLYVSRVSSFFNFRFASPCLVLSQPIEIRYPPLLDITVSLSKGALNNILNQMVDLFVKMWDIELPGNHVIGSRRIDPISKDIVPGPVLEETMWQE